MIKLFKNWSWLEPLKTVTNWRPKHVKQRSSIICKKLNGARWKPIFSLVTTSIFQQHVQSMKSKGCWRSEKSTSIFHNKLRLNPVAVERKMSIAAWQQMLDRNWKIATSQLTMIQKVKLKSDFNEVYNFHFPKRFQDSNWFLLATKYWAINVKRATRSFN